MRRLFTLFSVFVAVFVSSCAYDDTGIWNALNNLEKRVLALEELCKETNTNLGALQKIVEAISENEHIKNIAPIQKDGNVVGYTITFTSGNSVTIYNDNKQDGVGAVPQIGVAQDNDGVYYWTLDGDWLLDANGNKIKAAGEDGLTPKFKVENEYWYVSYDNGINWDVLGKATAEGGDCDCQSIIKGVEYDEEYVYITLTDGTVLTLPLDTASETPEIPDTPVIPDTPTVGIEAVDLGLSVKWASCNVGAERPEEYGDYFAWGEVSPKEEYTTQTYQYWTDYNGDCYWDQGEFANLGDISGNPQYDAATANWGGAWRMPTKAEQDELLNNCTWEWTTLNGVNGRKVTGPNGNSIFLPAAGCRYGTSSYYVGSSGYYWSSTPNEGNDYVAYSLDFYSDYYGWDWYDRGYGQSVRPVLE